MRGDGVDVASCTVEVHPLIRQRWSPATFQRRPVDAELLRTVFEAARWAPSSFNEQPWRFLVSTHADPDGLACFHDYLAEGNEWARGAPVLIVSAYATRFSRNGLANRLALRDLGAAEENLFLQACSLGLVMRQIAGFDHERLRRDLLPPGFEPGTVIALGHGADGGSAKARPRRGGDRKPLHDFVFAARWGEPWEA